MFKNRTKNYIVDEKAVLNFLRGVSSASYLISLFKEAEGGRISIFIPVSSYGFIYTWCQKNGYNPGEVHRIINSLPLSIFNFEKEFIEKVIDFCELNKEYEMPQAILIVLAREKSATIVTGDRDLKCNDPAISISWV